MDDGSGIAAIDDRTMVPVRVFGVLIAHRHRWYDLIYYLSMVNVYTR